VYYFLQDFDSAQHRQLILIDDGSLDGSFEKIVNTLESFSFKLSDKTEYWVDQDRNRHKTIELILGGNQECLEVLIVKLTSNKGQNWAIRQGLRYVKESNLIATMDSDGQHPLPILMNMFTECEEHSSVVARQIQRRDIFAKALVSGLFYKVFEILFRVNLPRNVGEFRVMKMELVDSVNLTPNELSLRLLVPLMSKRLKIVDYVAAERVGGKSKYTISRMIKLAILIYRTKRYINSNSLK